VENIKEVTKFFRRSVFTNSLIEKLQVAEIGDIITDEELTKICGKDTRPNQSGYGNLKSAIDYVLRNNGKVFERIRDANAIKCLQDKEKIVSIDNDLGLVNKRAKKLVRKTKTIDRSVLEPLDRTKVITISTQAEFLEYITKSKTQKKIEVKQIPEHFKPDLSKIKWE
jgi:hypothetical protein